MILLIDHDDSFTYNIKELLQNHEEEVIVYRENELSLSTIQKINPKAIVLSSGPKQYLQNSIAYKVIELYKKSTPILGIGLGHLIIGSYFNAKVKQLRNVQHGKPSLITHVGVVPFNYLEKPLEVMQYHSFTIDKDSLPSSLEIIATNMMDEEIMAIRHKEYKIYGLQFHPESIGTKNGNEMIKNFLIERKGRVK